MLNLSYAHRIALLIICSGPFALLTESVAAQPVAEVVAVSDTTTREFELIEPRTEIQDYAESVITRSEVEERDRPQRIIGGSVVQFGADLIPVDFSAFDDLLGRSITEKIVGDGVFIFGGDIVSRRRFDYGFRFGLLFNEMQPDDDDPVDSLTVEMRTTHYEFNLGYRLIHYRQFRLRPRAGLIWRRFRAIVSPEDSKYPIEEYLNAPNWDLRFNQMYASIGLDARLRLKTKQTPIQLTIGMYGGYLQPFNHRPWIWTAGNNRLKTDRRLVTQNLQFSVYLLQEF